MIDLTHPGIANTLKARLLALRRSYGMLLNTSMTCSYSHVLAQVDGFVDDLRGRNGALVGKATAGALHRTLIDPWECRDLAFWTSPLGQAIAWWDGASYESMVTGPVDRRRLIEAAGLTRQGSYKAAAKMDRDAEGNPTAEAVTAYLQRTYPHPVKEVPSDA
jgi:hypothetical protein